jgi:hypothetical protein
MDQVAAYLDMPEVAVYEVATFYAMYDLEPVGRHKICVCNSVSCMLGGAEDLMEHIEKKYGVTPGGPPPTASSRSRSSSASAPAGCARGDGRQDLSRVRDARTPSTSSSSSTDARRHLDPGLADPTEGRAGP